MKTYLKKFILIIVFAVPFSVQAEVEWLSGTISNMWIYPTYFIVEQGAPGGGKAGCKDVSNRWAAYWSDFTEVQQNRILSTLLSVRMAGKKIGTVVSADPGVCGPEGWKKFLGYIQIAKD